MKASRNIGLALVFIFVLGAVPVMAGANFSERYAFKWEFVPEDDWQVMNECNGELVHVWGWFHDQWLVLEDAAGGYHWVNHWRAQGKGVGVESGDQYIFSGGDLDPENPNHDGGSHVYSADGLRYTATGTWYMNLIGQGRTPSYRMRCFSHTTINANGEMVTAFEHCSIPCGD